MAPRAHWKGYLKLSLVSCPVSLYPATAAEERISFRQVNRQTGNRLRQQLVDTVTGEVVQSEDKGRGYQVGENQFVVVKEEELEAAREEARSRPYSAAPVTISRQPPSTEASSVAGGVLPLPEASRGRPGATGRKKASEDLPPASPPQPTPPPPVVNDRIIDRFVRRTEIDPRYLDAPYYVVPRDEVGQEAFAVIRDAIRDKEMVGMGRVVLARRERPFVVRAMTASSASRSDMPTKSGIRPSTLLAFRRSNCRGRYS